MPLRADTDMDDARYLRLFIFRAIVDADAR